MSAQEKLSPNEQEKIWVDISDMVAKHLMEQFGDF